MSKIKLAGKSISEILKRIKRAQRNKRATQNQEKAGLSTKSIKPFNYRAGARDEQIVPVKKQSQKGSSFQPHRVRGKQGAASIKETSEGSAASWRDEMDKYFGDLRPSKFFKKASGGDINTGMKKLSPKQKAIAAKAPPPDKIDAKDFAVLKAEKAKGRGMGLQDESVQPGKVMKARYGKAIKPDPTAPINRVAPKVTDVLKKKKLPGRIGTALGIGSMLVPAAYAAAKQYKDYKSAKNRDKAKVKKYSKGGDLRLDYIDRQTRLNEKATGKKDYIAESKKTRREEYGAAKDRYPNKTDKLRGIAKNVGRALTPSFAAAKSVYDKLSKSSAEKYSVGGGADLGKKGIIKGINANLQDKAERRLNVPDRTDIKKQKASVTKLKEQARRSRLETMKDRQTGRPVYERMGGGMAKKYNKGGGADTGTIGTLRSMKINDEFPFKNFGKKEDRLTRRDLEYAKAVTVKKAVPKKMGGGMMQRPMGYKSGTMVKARGCKLGRTRPTKIT